MIRISVEVSRGASRQRVVVKAESIKRALEIVERQNFSCAAKVVFPIEPEEFFVGDASVTAEPLYKGMRPAEYKIPSTPYTGSSVSEGSEKSA